jgi:hypothetical protein
VRDNGIGIAGVAPHHFRWLWPVAVFVTFAVALPLVTVPGRGRVARVGLIVTALAAVTLTVFDGAPVDEKRYHVDWDLSAAEKGGYDWFMRKEIFDYIEDGEELVQEPFQRLVKQNLLVSYRYQGFWAPMDTLKDQQQLESLHETGRPAWAVWQR